MIDDLYDDPEFQELLYGYLGFLQQSIAEARVSLERKDYRHLRDFGHNLIGTAGSYQFDHLTDLGKKINMAARKGDDEAIKRLIEEIEDRVTEYRKEDKSTE